MWWTAYLKVFMLTMTSLTCPSLKFLCSQKNLLPFQILAFFFFRKFVIGFFVQLCGEQLTYNFLCWRWRRWLAPLTIFMLSKKPNSELKKNCENSEFIFLLNYVVNNILTIFYADDDVVDLPFLTIFMFSKKLNSKFQILVFFLFLIRNSFFFC